MSPESFSCDAQQSTELKIQESTVDIATLRENLRNNDALSDLDDWYNNYKEQITAECKRELTHVLSESIQSERMIANSAEYQNARLTVMLLAKIYGNPVDIPTYHSFGGERPVSFQLNEDGVDITTEKSDRTQSMYTYHLENRGQQVLEAETGNLDARLAQNLQGLIDQDKQILQNQTEVWRILNTAIENYSGPETDTEYLSLLGDKLKILQDIQATRENIRENEARLAELSRTPSITPADQPEESGKTVSDAEVNEYITSFHNQTNRPQGTEAMKIAYPERGGDAVVNRLRDVVPEKISDIPAEILPHIDALSGPLSFPLHEEHWEAIRVYFEQNPDANTEGVRIWMLEKIQTDGVQITSVTDLESFLGSDGMVISRDTQLDNDMREAMQSGEAIILSVDSNSITIKQGVNIIGRYDGGGNRIANTDAVAAELGTTTEEIRKRGSTLHSSGFADTGFTYTMNSNTGGTEFVNTFYTADRGGDAVATRLSNASPEKISDLPAELRSHIDSIYGPIDFTRYADHIDAIIVYFTQNTGSEFEMQKQVTLEALGEKVQSSGMQFNSTADLDRMMRLASLEGSRMEDQPIAREIRASLDAGQSISIHTEGSNMILQSGDTTRIMDMSQQFIVRQGEEGIIPDSASHSTDQQSEKERVNVQVNDLLFQCDINDRECQDKTEALLQKAAHFNKVTWRDAESVMAIQRAVGADPDGKMGTETVKKIIIFQHLNGLERDGRVGGGTADKINALTGAGLNFVKQNKADGTIGVYGHIDPSKVGCKTVSAQEKSSTQPVLNELRKAGTTTPF